jgi:hypothetical protein
MRHRPHHVAPCKETVRAIIAYKNFAAYRGISHIGLGVSAMTNVRALRAAGFWVDIWPITSAQELADRLALAQEKAYERDEIPVSHVLVSAPWIPTEDLARLCNLYPDIHFAICSHSNAGFLQADPNGVKLLREGLELQTSRPNFRVAANSQKFAHWMERAYFRRVTLLPNIYWIENEPARRRWIPGHVLRIGIFGAVRPLKNALSSVGASIEIANRLNTNTEVWICAGRLEGGGDVVLNSIRAMVKGLMNIGLVEKEWETWPRFRETVRHMHLLLQVSYTETFNMVTADGIAEGVPSVVSEAIEWVPKRWKAEVDDVNDIANVGVALLRDEDAAADGMRALREHNSFGLRKWSEYFLG